MIKLQWDKPDINPQFADRYEIEHQTRFGTWGPAGATEKNSFRVKGLKQDTRYYFRISEKSEFTNVIE